MNADTNAHAIDPPPNASASAAPDKTGPVFIGVDIAIIDQHGDPGFVHAHGDFHTPAAAAGFAITQTHHAITTRELDRVAVILTHHTPLDATARGTVTDDHYGTGDDGRSVTVIGSTSEIACALAADPTYRTGVRRVELPTPPDIDDIIAATTADHDTSRHPDHHTDSHPTDAGRDDEDEDGDGWFVHVHTVRPNPNPIPNSTAVIGPLERSRAEAAAGLLTYRLGGDLTAHPDRAVIDVHHTAALDSADTPAVQRYERITAARALAATLPPGSHQYRQLLADAAAVLDTARHPGGHR